MSKSNISEPFLLATYTSTIRDNHPQKKPGVYATVSRKSSSDDYVTVAVQADGVHVLDVSSLHPVISHTMGPATSFACPPLTHRATSSSVSTTYAVIATSSELSSPEEGGRTLWVWQDDTSLGAKGKQKLKSSKIVLPHDQTAHTLFSSNELSCRIAILSTNGSVSLIDADSLQVKSSNKTTELSSSNPTSVIQAFLFSSSQCSFFKAQNGAVLVIVSSGPPKATKIRICAIGEGDSILDKREYTIPVEAEQICSVSCSSSGCLTALTTDGSWHSYQLSASTELESFSTPPAQLSPPLALAALTFLPTPNSLAQVGRSSVSILALTSSHVLLAGVCTPSQEIVLLLWDLQFSVLLASQALPIPSTLLSFPLHFQLVLGPQTPTKTRTQITGQALLIISALPPWLPPGKEKANQKAGPEYKSTTVLFVVPYTVPSSSTISAALGLGGVSEKWLRELGEQCTKPTPAEEGRAKLMSAIRSALEGGQGQAATAAFMKWASKNGDGESSDIDTDPKPADPSVSSRFGYNFVKELLGVVLLRPQPTSNVANAYSPEIIRYLLESQVVCSAMIETPGSLLGALRARNDWSSAELAFGTVPDLRESEIIDTLQFVVSQQRRSSVQPLPSHDAMEVDTPAVASSTAAATSLSTFLNLAITYPTSCAPLVSAVRKQIRDAEDLTVLLKLLNKWLTRRTAMEEKLFPSKKDLKKTEFGIWTVVGRTNEQGKRKKVEEIPPLDKIISFIQVILDASFLSLLQHKNAHQVLQHINTQLNPEIAFANLAESLRGPLEPFAIAQEKAIKESKIPEKEKEKERQKIDWRQRKKRFDGDVGVYQLEELVL